MPDRALTFGRYRLEPRGGLMSGAREVRLTPKALALLSFLAERPGEVITKDELFAAVWPETTRGRCGARDLHPGASERPSRTMPGIRATSRHCTGAATASSESSAGAPNAARSGALAPLPDRPSIAVLPFANMSGDPDQEYFADGISEDLITGLSRIRWLFVIARNSTLRLQEPRRRREAGLARAWRALRARRQRAPRRQAAAHHRAARRCDRPAAITGPNATTASSATFSPCRTRSPAASRPRSSRTCWPPKGVRALSRSPDDLGAWELVARAQTHFWRMTQADYETAIAILERAVEIYPDYAPAPKPAGILPRVRRAHGMDRSRRRACSRRASTPCAPSRSMIAIPGDISRSAIAAMMERRTEELIAAFRRAVNLNPNSAAAHTSSEPRPGVCRTAIARRSSMPKSDQAQPARSDDGALSREASRSRTTSPGDIAEAMRYTTEAAAAAPRLSGRAPLRCAAWPRPDASRKRARSSRDGRARATRSCRSPGSGRTCPTRHPN